MSAKVVEDDPSIRALASTCGSQKPLVSDQPSSGCCSHLGVDYSYFLLLSPLTPPPNSAFCLSDEDIFKKSRSGGAGGMVSGGIWAWKAVATY